MPIRPIDPHEVPPNPFILEQSKLLKATAALSKEEAAKKANATQPSLPLATQSKTEQHFEISTRQIISLIVRFRLRSLTYDQLKNLPYSQLNKEEKEFVDYLRRNPRVFNRIASLDNDPGSISVDDIKIAARLAGDALVLSDEDVQYLKESPIKKARLQQDEQQLETRRTSQKLQTQDLINTIKKLNPLGLTYEELLAINASETALRGKSLKSLEFLQSPAVSKVLEKVVEPYDGMLTPEALRVLTSLLWNPAIYGASPIVFYRTAPLESEHEKPVLPMGQVGAVDGFKRKNIHNDQFRPSLRLEAHHILNICHKLSDDGHVSLKQIQQYIPENKDEEKALNLLRQTKIFQALAGLDHDPDSLSDDDIKLALAEGTIMLSDPYMVLVILP